MSNWQEQEDDEPQQQQQRKRREVQGQRQSQWQPKAVAEAVTTAKGGRRQAGEGVAGDVAPQIKLNELKES